MTSSFVEYLNGLRQRAGAPSTQPVSLAPEPSTQPVSAAPFPAPPSASTASASPPDPPFSVALRGDEILVLGLTSESLVLSAPAAERLARRLFDAAALARGAHPGAAQD